MPNLMSRLVIGTASFLLSGGMAGAVVLSDDYTALVGSTADQTSIELGLAEEFDSVVAIYNNGRLCTGAVVSSTAVLTARHCTDGRSASNWTVYFGTAETGFTSIGTTSVTTLSADPSAPSEYFNGTDLAVLTLSQPVTGVEPFEILTMTDYIETAAIVGYGRTGTGSTGYTSGVDYNRRFATNVYETYESKANGNRLLFADFDSGEQIDNSIARYMAAASSAIETPYEGLIGPGDSGGPLLFQRDGQWVVAGVATGVRAYDQVSDSDYGDLGVWTAIYSQEAIDLLLGAGATLYSTSIVIGTPVPGSLWMLGAGVAVLTVVRRRSRRAQTV